MPGQLDPPDHLVGGGVDHLDRRLTRVRVASETGNDVFVVRRHVGVVDRKVDRNAPDDLVRGDVDHIDDRGKRATSRRLEPRTQHLGGPFGDRRVDLPLLLVDDDLVGPPRQRNPL